MSTQRGTSGGAATQRPHVLIVSDDEGLTSFLGEGLVFGGFWTSVVASGIQTLEVFRLRSFDLVLIDAALPGLTAADVIRRLRHAPDAGAGSPRTDVPILVVSGGNDDASVAESLTAGADGSIAAPLDLEELVPDLHGVVAEWRRRHPGRPFADEAAHQPETPKNPT